MRFNFCASGRVTRCRAAVAVGRVTQISCLTRLIPAFFFEIIQPPNTILTFRYSDDPGGISKIEYLSEYCSESRKQEKVWPHCASVSP